MNSPLPDDLISAYADGETSPEETRAAEALVASSPDAKRELDDFRALSALLKGLPAESLPGDFARTVLQRAERATLLGTADASPASEPIGSRRRTFWISAVSFVGTAAAVLGVMFLLQRQSPQDLSRHTATTAPESIDTALADAQPVRVGREPAFGTPAPGSRMAASPADGPEAALEPSAGAANLTTPGEGMASISNPLRYRDYDGLRAAEVGDVVEAMKAIGPDEVVVVQLTVLDRVEGRNSLQLLLQRNDIAIEAPAAPPEAAENGNYSVFVESDVEQISSVFAELQREQQVAGIEVANSVPVQMLNDDFSDNGYSALPGKPVDGVDANGYPAINSINRAIARKQSLELQQQSLKSQYADIPHRSSALNSESDPLSSAKDELATKNRNNQIVGKSPGSNPPQTDAAGAETADKKNAKREAIDAVSGNRGRVLRVDAMRQKEIVTSSYGNYLSESNASRFSIPAQMARTARPGPPPLPEPSDEERKLTIDRERAEDRRGSFAVTANEARTSGMHSVQVLFVLVPQEPVPAAPATETRPVPADPDGAS